MKRIISIAMILTLVMSISACGKTETSTDIADTTTKTDTTAKVVEKQEDKKVITIWRGDGTDKEEALYNQQITDFNSQSKDTELKFEVFPYNDFGKTVRAAISTNSLPELIYVDGTEVANLAFSNALMPLDEYISDDMKNNLATSAFSKYNGKTYGIAQQDGGLALWANKKHLTEAGARIPTYEAPWTKDEFLEVLSKLKKVNGVKYPLDMKVNYGNGYVIYAWQPIIKSFGSDWYNADNMKAEGALNSDKTAEALDFIVSLVKNGYVNSSQTSDTEFKEKRSSLDLTGHWNYPDYKAALGDDLILVPLPDFGSGSQTGVGGLPYAITSKAKEKDTMKNAYSFIEFALGEKYQQQINTTNGSLPVNKNILSQLTEFKQGGPLYLYAQQLTGGKFPVRPPSPAFPTYQSEVGKAAFNILSGADVKAELANAAKAIDKVIDENKY
jgi:multiple sugar transport system substrate-binding protein